MDKLWFEVLCYAVGMCAVAALLFWAVWQRLGSDLALFRRLDADLFGEDGEHPWLKWVIGTVGRMKDQVPWTREDGLKRYDAYTGGLLVIQGLQRLPVIPPLLGVLITVLKFASFNPAVSGSDVRQVVEAAAPLFVGVGSGAAVAVFVQFLAVLAGWRLAATRQAAADWFDRYMWPNQVASRGGSAVGDGWVKVAEQFTKELQEATQRFRSTTGGWLDATTDLKGATERLILQANSAANQFATVTAGIAASVQPLQKAADSLGQSGDLVQKTFAAAAGLESAVGKLTPAVTTLVTSAGTLATQAGTLKAACDAVKTAADAVGTDLPRASKALTEQGAAAVKKFAEASDEVAKAVAPLSDAAKSLKGGGDKIQQLGTTLDDLRTAVKDQLTPAAKAVAAAGADIKANAEALKLPVTHFATAATSLDGDVKKLSASVDHLKDAGQKLQTAAGSMSDFATRSVNPLKDGFKDLSALLTECRSVAKELSRLPELHTELKPLLTTLEEAGKAANAASAVPARVEAATREALGHMRGALGETTTSLRAAADQSAAALKGLPQQFGQSLVDARDGVIRHADEFVLRLEEFLEQAVVRKARS